MNEEPERFWTGRRVYDVVLLLILIATLAVNVEVMMGLRATRAANAQALLDLQELRVR